MKLEKLNFKIGQKYIINDIFKRIENNFLCRKYVSFDTVDTGTLLTIYVSYKGCDAMMVECKACKGLIEILDITLA